MSTNLNNSAVLVHQNMTKIPSNIKNNTSKNNIRNMNIVNHHINKTSNNIK
jgi:hypothetical protein